MKQNSARFSFVLFLLVVLISVIAGCARFSHSGMMGDREDFEVWLVDQSNSPGLAYGGTLYIYDGSDLTGSNSASTAPKSVIILSEKTDELCFQETGAHAVRPHMLLFNAAQTHAILSYVASGHVVIMDAATRAPVACFQTSVGAGGARQAHAAVPAPDDSYILVANQNGKRLERIDTNYRTNTFVLNADAMLDLAACVTPNGNPCQSPEMRPDNAPICPIIDSSSARAFVTLRGGGLLVVNGKSSPMTILAEYDKGVVHGNGCGGVEAGGAMFINSGGATSANLDEFDLYKFPLSGYAPSNPPNVPAPTVVFSDDGAPNRDSHGMAVDKKEKYLWVADRAGNLIEVFDVKSNKRVNTVRIAGAESADPTPDLADISPSGEHLFLSLRGPNPLSGDPHASTGGTPGIGVVEVMEGGKSGMVKRVVKIQNIDAGGVERADAHAIRVRRVQ